ncbi:MAG: hypothetical protein IPK65_02685 [Gammaproteobacteria bacterium]|nr:hypothetical protein [Gammaproteobacteria bacterium]
MDLNPVSAAGMNRHQWGHARAETHASPVRHSAAHGDEARSRCAPDNAPRCRRTETATPVTIFTEQAYAVDASRARSLQLEIMTAEGDRVAISLSDARAVQLAAYRAADSAATAVSLGASISASGNLAYTLEGELSAEETAAIEELLGRVDQLAGRFFSGDMDGLLSQVSGFGFDIEELASFSLSMDMTQTVRATAAYRSVQAMAANDAGNADPFPDLPSFIGELDAARTASAGRKGLFDELLKAAAEVLGGDAASVSTLLDRVLSALDVAQPGRVIEADPVPAA